MIDLDTMLQPVWEPSLARRRNARIFNIHVSEPEMKSEKRTEYLTRASLLKLLSDEEAANVSTAETAAGLGAGEEYVDLGRLSSGVLRARGAEMPMGRVLPRKAVQKETWEKIVTQLGAAHLTAPARSVR